MNTKKKKTAIRRNFIIKFLGTTYKEKILRTAERKIVHSVQRSKHDESRKFLIKNNTSRETGWDDNIKEKEIIALEFYVQEEYHAKVKSERTIFLHTNRSIDT